MTDATERFTSRVDDYVRHRPTYPAALIEHLEERGALTRESVVADVGSGTGLLARLFLDAGNRVIGVEPNRAMREAGERELRNFSTFTSVDGTAEATTLPAASVNIVVAGQAFHWFDRPRTKAEFPRVLRVPGWVALVWNERLTNTPFLVEYEAMLNRFSTEYGRVDHRRITGDVIAEFFAPGPFELAKFPNHQRFDFAGLRGRVLSSSYTPPPEHADHERMMAELARLFDAHVQDGHVRFEYETLVYSGRLA